MRTKLNPPFKGGGMKIGLVPVGRVNGNIPNPWVSSRWFLQFPIPLNRMVIVTERTKGQSVSNDFLLFLQGLWVVENSSSVFLNIQDTNTGKKTWKETRIANIGKTGETLCGWEQIGSSKLSSTIELFNLIPTKNHSYKFKKYSFSLSLCLKISF